MTRMAGAAAKARGVVSVLAYQSPFADGVIRHRENVNGHRIGMRIWVRRFNRGYQFLTPVAARHPLPRRLATAAAATLMDESVSRQQRANPDWDGFLQRYAVAGSEMVITSRWAPNDQFSAGQSLFLFPDEFEATVHRGLSVALGGTFVALAALVADHRLRGRTVRLKSLRYTVSGYAAALSYRYRLNLVAMADDHEMVTKLRSRRHDATVRTAHALAQSAPSAAALADLMKPEGVWQHLPNADELWPLISPYLQLRDAWSAFDGKTQTGGSSDGRVAPREPGAMLGYLVDEAVRALQAPEGQPTDLNLHVQKVVWSDTRVADLDPEQVSDVRKWLEVSLGREQLSTRDVDGQKQTILAVKLIKHPEYLGDGVTFEIGVGEHVRRCVVPPVPRAPTGARFDPTATGYLVGAIWGLMQIADDPLPSGIVTASCLAALVWDRDHNRPKQHHIAWNVTTSAAALAAWRISGRVPGTKSDGLRKFFPANAVYMPIMFISGFWAQRDETPALSRMCTLGAALVGAGLLGGALSTRRRHDIPTKDIIGELLYVAEVAFAMRSAYAPWESLAGKHAVDNEHRLGIVASTRSHYTFMTVLAPALRYIEEAGPGFAKGAADAELALERLTCEGSESSASSTDDHDLAMFRATRELKRFKDGQANIAAAQDNRDDLLANAATLEQDLVDHVESISNTNRTAHIVVDAPSLGDVKADGTAAGLFHGYHDLPGEYRPATEAVPLPLPFRVNLRAAAGVAARHDRPLIVDIDRTIVHLDTPPNADLGTAALVEAIGVIAGVRQGFVQRADGTHPRIRKVMFVSNANRPFDHLAVIEAGRAAGLEVRIVMRARKARPNRGPLAPYTRTFEGAVVYGDHIANDGRLARALGGIWVQPPWATDVKDITSMWRRSAIVESRGGVLNLNTVAEHLVGNLRFRRLFHRLL